MHIISTKEHHSKNNFSLGYDSNNDRLQTKRKKSCASSKGTLTIKSKSTQYAVEVPLSE